VRSISEHHNFESSQTPAHDRLVNMQSVLVDTQRDVAGVQRKIDRLLAEDADHRAIVSVRLTCGRALTVAPRDRRTRGEVSLDPREDRRSGQDDA
jgi:hypothetical protein